MVTKKKAIQKATPAQVRTVQVNAGNLSDLVGVIANELEKRSGSRTLQDPNSLTTARADRPNLQLSGNAAAPTPPAVTELVRCNRDRAGGLLDRLLKMESSLCDTPPQGKEVAQCAPAPPGVGGVLVTTGNYIDDAHDAVTRISNYLGVDV